MCRGTSSVGRATSPSGKSGKSRTSCTAIQSKRRAVLLVMAHSTAIVWFRRDLRVHDHPALRAALDSHERVTTAFCLDDRPLHGRHASGPRTQFLLECLPDLDESLQQRGGGLVIRHGRPETELAALAEET